MSKTSKRKSSEGTSKNSKSLSNKDLHKRPSVFERLGTKATSLSVNTSLLNSSNQSEFCRNWALSGTCPYGKNCKLSYSHVLISPSKRSFKKDIDLEKRIQNSLVCRGSPSELGTDWESWDQSELEYEDEKALERRRQLLQRELELQIKKEIQKQDSSKYRSSSTSSDSSSSSSSSSSSDSSSDSSISNQKKTEHKSISPTYLERNIIKKNMGKGLHKESPPRKSSTSKKASPPRKPRRKSLSPVRKPALSPTSKSKPVPSNRSNDRGTRRNDSPIGSRGRSPDRKQSSRSSGSSRRSPRPSAQRRGRSPRPRPPSRNRSPDRRKDDDRRSKDDGRRSDRKSDFRDKREAAREKERLEALERCRERQREREALAKEKERERKERDKRRRSYGSSRRSPPRDEKRHDRKAERDRSYSRERARDRALERVMERRGSSRERSYERPYSQGSPSYRTGGSDRNRYGNERLSPERSSTRDDRRGRRWVESREKQSGNHEWSEHADWESRSSRCEERGDEWCSYSGSISGNGEWRSRSHLSHHDDRRSHHTDKEKDHSIDLPKGEKELKETNLSSGSNKRSAEEIEIEIKRSRLEEVSLQEELSDISDDPDDILNREDSEFVDQEAGDDETADGSLHDTGIQMHSQEEGTRLLTPPGDRNMDSKITEDDAIVSLDFEEISDEELEEESKCVSVVDALGVDWASLVAEWKSPKEVSKEGSARTNWSSSALFKRIKISKDFAGDELVESLLKKKLLGGDNIDNADKRIFPSNLLHNKQALSARVDIIIRRQLSGLPVITCETHPTTGLCQWAV